METAQEIVQQDLQYICNSLREEFTAMSGKNLLITGGAGFLGYYLVQSALHWNTLVDESKKIHVTVFDNYVRGVPAWLTQLKKNPELTLKTINMIEPLPPSLGTFHFIIHAAGIASPKYYRLHPIETMDANINGLRNLLNYTKKQQESAHPVEGFLFYSSSEIYGDPASENIPTPEEYRGYVSCTGPRSCYDESKRYGETLCVNFAQQYGVPVKIARPFNNYGPGLKITDTRVLPDFARNIFDGKDIVMFSDGTPTRTFCYSADAIIGYYKVLVKGRPGESYNIGVEKPEIAIHEVAQKMTNLARDLFGYKGKVIRGVSSEADYLVDNPNRRCPIISKARKELGYTPTIGLDEGLRRTMLWYQGNQEGEEA
jgi:UDP-glucuronate decarboxylase